MFVITVVGFVVGFVVMVIDSGIVIVGVVVDADTLAAVVVCVCERERDRGPYRDWETDRKSTRLNSSHRL